MYTPSCKLNFIFILSYGLGPTALFKIRTSDFLKNWKLFSAPPIPSKKATVFNFLYLFLSPIKGHRETDIWNGHEKNLFLFHF